MSVSGRSGPAYLPLQLRMQGAEGLVQSGQEAGSATSQLAVRWGCAKGV